MGVHPAAPTYLLRCFKTSFALVGCPQHAAHKCGMNEWGAFIHAKAIFYLAESLAEPSHQF